MSVVINIGPNFAGSFTEIPERKDQFSSQSSTYIYAKFQELGEIAQTHLKPIVIGIASGAILFCTSVSIVLTFHYFGIDPVMAPGYEEFIPVNLFYVSVVGHILEEFAFRGTFQDVFKKIGEAILPDIDVPLFSNRKIKLAVLIAVIANSIFFGLLHFFGGGIIQVCTATIGGLVLGTMKETQGMSSSISAHITNNSIAVFFFLIG